MILFGEKAAIDHEEYKRLVKILNKDPELYKSTIISALADSPVSARDFLFEYCLKLGFESRDYRTKNAQYSDEHRMHTFRKLNEWEETPNNHFTVDDIPEWVRKKLVYGGIGVVRDRVPDMMRELARRSWNSRNFARLNDTYHFTKNGYEQIIAYALIHNLITEAEAEKWRNEVNDRY